MTYPKTELARRIITYPIRLIALIPFGLVSFGLTNWSNQDDVAYFKKFVESFYKI